MSQGAGIFGLGVLGGVGRLGWIAGACAALTAGFVVYRSVPLYEAGRIQGASGTGGESGATTVAVFTEAVKRDAGQINGRSLFYIPAPPPPKPVYRPPPPPEEPKPTGPPPPPPPPRTYGGPKIIGAAIDTVWFENGKRLTAGGEADGDLRVIEITQVPWSARLEWKGIEFDVPFIPRDGVVIKELSGSESGGSGSAPTVPPAAEEPVKEPAAAPGVVPPATSPPGTSPSAEPASPPSTSPASTPPAPSPAEPSAPPPTEKP